MDYSFNIDIATKYGVDEAIFLHNLYFWIVKNEANGRHYYDGKSWTYNSAKAMSDLFPFWSANKIDKLTRKMRDNGLIHIGNYNKSKFDRTKWYALSEEIWEAYGRCPISQTAESEPAKQQNGNGEPEEPIPDSKPYGNPDILFAQFWKEYPRKCSKDDAFKAFKSRKPDSTLVSQMVEAIQARKASGDWSRENQKFIPYPATWIRAGGWEDEIVPSDPKPQGKVWKSLD